MAKIDYHIQDEEKKFIQINKSEFMDHSDQMLAKKEYLNASFEVAFEDEKVYEQFNEPIEPIRGVLSFKESFEYTNESLQAISFFTKSEHTALQEAFTVFQFLSDISYIINYETLKEKIKLYTNQYAMNAKYSKETSFKTFKNPYALEVNDVKITYTDFMLPNEMSFYAFFTNVKIKFKYFNKESFNKSNGTISKYDYLNYMTQAIYSMPEENTFNYEIKADGEVGCNEIITNLGDGSHLIKYETITQEVCVNGAVKFTKYPDIPRIMGNVITSEFTMGDKQKCHNINYFFDLRILTNPYDEIYWVDNIQDGASFTREYTIKENEVKVYLKYEDDEEHSFEVVTSFDNEGYPKQIDVKHYNKDYTVTINFYK